MNLKDASVTLIEHELCDAPVFRALNNHRDGRTIVRWNEAKSWWREVIGMFMR